jgi:hypothetical protein
MSTSTMKTPPAFSSTPAGWASKASSRSAEDPPINPGESYDWLKLKNPNAPAAHREALIGKAG